MRLRDVSKILVEPKIVFKTLEVLRGYGKRNLEGFALWVGSISGNEAEIEDIWVPPQKSIRNEDGVGYFVSNDVLLNISRTLQKKQMQLIAQVHSHPGRAYHSEADDAYAIVTTNGGFSLVVPNFGFCPDKITDWAVYRLQGTGWVGLSKQEITQTFISTQKNLSNSLGGICVFA